MTVTSSNFERRENEFYETPEWVTNVLLDRFPIHGMTIWEPAAGKNKIVNVLRTRGARCVYASDIVDYGVGIDEISDFTASRNDRVVVNGIITNPPYGKGNRLAVRFIEKALERCTGLVAMLLTAKFDSGKTRQHLFGDNPRFAAKIVLLDRISWTGDGATGTEDHAWYVFTENPRLPRAPVILYATRDGQ